jgi:hypothetical protein
MVDRFREIFPRQAKLWSYKVIELRYDKTIRSGLCKLRQLVEEKRVPSRPLLVPIDKSYSSYICTPKNAHIQQKLIELLEPEATVGLAVELIKSINHLK